MLFYIIHIFKLDLAYSMNIRIKINLFYSILAHLEQEFLIELIDICYLIPHNYYATRDGHILFGTNEKLESKQNFCE